MTGVILLTWLGLMTLPGMAEAAQTPVLDPTPGTTPAQAAAPEATPAPAPCTCAAAKDANGWCEAHGVGYVAGVMIPSRLLYDAMDAHGHVLDLSTFECPSCKKAIAESGFCEEHRIGFVEKQAYFSRLTYELARGKKKDPAKISCPVCRKNAESHGWCERHDVGMVGNVAIRDRQAYEAAAHGVEILEAAVATLDRCEWCALAMVTDSRCPRCKISYKDGKPLPPPPDP